MTKKPSFYELEDEMIIPESAQSTLNNATIEDVIEQVIRKIDISHRALNPKLNTQPNTQDTLDTLDTKIAGLKDQSINSATIADFRFQLTSPGTDSRRWQEAALELVYIYTSLAQVCCDEGDIVQAWYALTKSEHYLGMLNGFDANNKAGEIKAGTSRAKDRSINSAKTKNENQQKLKELISSTLNNVNITINLTSTKDAAKSISIKLRKTLHEEKLLQGKNSSEIADLFEKMIDTDEDLDNAFWDRKALQ